MDVGETPNFAFKNKGSKGSPQIWETHSQLYYIGYFGVIFLQIGDTCPNTHQIIQIGEVNPNMGATSKICP